MHHRVCEMDRLNEILTFHVFLLSKHRYYRIEFKPWIINYIQRNLSYVFSHSCPQRQWKSMYINPELCHEWGTSLPCSSMVCNNDLYHNFQINSAACNSVLIFNDSLFAIAFVIVISETAFLLLELEPSETIYMDKHHREYSGQYIMTSSD